MSDTRWAKRGCQVWYVSLGCSKHFVEGVKTHFGSYQSFVTRQVDVQLLFQRPAQLLLYRGTQAVKGNLAQDASGHTACIRPVVVSISTSCKSCRSLVTTTSSIVSDLSSYSRFDKIRVQRCRQSGRFPHRGHSRSKLLVRTIQRSHSTL